MINVEESKPFKLLKELSNEFPKIFISDLEKCSSYLVAKFASLNSDPESTTYLEFSKEKLKIFTNIHSFFNQIDANWHERLTEFKNEFLESVEILLAGIKKNPIQSFKIRNDQSPSTSRSLYPFLREFTIPLTPLKMNLTQYLQDDGEVKTLHSTNDDEEGDLISENGSLRELSVESLDKKILDAQNTYGKRRKTTFAKLEASKISALNDKIDEVIISEDEMPNNEELSSKKIKNVRNNRRKTLFAKMPTSETLDKQTPVKPNTRNRRKTQITETLVLNDKSDKLVSQNEMPKNEDLSVKQTTTKSNARNRRKTQTMETKTLNDQVDKLLSQNEKPNNEDLSIKSSIRNRRKTQTIEILGSKHDSQKQNSEANSSTEEAILDMDDNLENANISNKGSLKEKEDILDQDIQNLSGNVNIEKFEIEEILSPMKTRKRRNIVLVETELKKSPDYLKRKSNIEKEQPTNSIKEKLDDLKMKSKIKRERSTNFIEEDLDVPSPKRLKISIAENAKETKKLMSKDSKKDFNPLEDGNSLIAGASISGSDDFTPWMELHDPSNNIPSQPGVYEIKVIKAKRAAYIDGCSDLKSNITLAQSSKCNGNRNLEKFLERNKNSVHVRFKIVSSFAAAQDEVQRQIASFIDKFGTTPAFN